MVRRHYSKKSDGLRRECVRCGKEALECCWHRESLAWLGLHNCGLGSDCNWSQWTRDDKEVATPCSGYHSTAISVEDSVFDE